MTRKIISHPIAPIFCLLLFVFSAHVAAEELVWSDEFNGVTLDLQKWDKPEYNRRGNDNGPDGWWLREDSFLDGQGNLVIRARKIANRNSDNDPFDYSTGAIRSIGKFEQKFGKFEIRCRLPRQPGWWVAFWLFSPGVGNVDGSGEDGTEIDIFEGFGWTDHMQHALHWDGYGDAHQSIGKSHTMEGIRDGYHTFTLEWYENIYLFFIDGVESWRTDAGGVSKVPAYVKITAELSTESWAINSGWANDPATATYPDSFLVDYVRVYKLDNTICTRPEPNDHIAYRKTAASSSQKSTRYSARRAVDGNITTRWESEAGAPQWLSIDLAESYRIDKVVLSWAALFGTEYKIEVAEGADGPWIECLHITDNTGRGAVSHEFPVQTGRFIRMYGITSIDSTGFSLSEMAVYGEKDTRVKEGKGNDTSPTSPLLLQNYPNPFNTGTVIRYAVPGDFVQLTIHNLSGQHIATLVNEVQTQGHYAVTWDAGDCSSGIYIARLRSGHHVMYKKLIIQK
ncbi:glycosyl hydrolase family protein [candidate division KSB1 bacterium]|nr:family 16 glycosylhydrolase [candidate division KSB1 bacterium]RQW02605.1 MAG: glycosyl hydrolase family protein [candidate division KSB1 bacterium]